MLKYNGNFVYYCNYNGNSLSELVYNGVTVWKAPFCNAGATSVSFARTSSSKTVSLAYNVPLTITSSASWCTVSGTFTEASLNSATSYFRTNLLSISVSENTGSARSATITIKYGSTTLRTISVSQAVGETWSVTSYHLSIPITTVNLSYKGTSEVSFYKDTASFSITSYVTETSNLGNTRNTWQDPKYSVTDTSFFDRVTYDRIPSTTRTCLVDLWVSTRSQSGTITFSLGNQSNSVYIKVV